MGDENVLLRVHRDIDQLIQDGYEQVSRKYRRLARLPDGMNGIEAMRTVDPGFVRLKMEHLEQECAEMFLRVYSAEKVELTVEEFEEFLRKRDE